MNPLLSAEDYQSLTIGSGIDPAVIQERGYETVTDLARTFELGFTSRTQKKLFGLAIPLWTVDGVVESFQMRPVIPNVDAKGKARKYESIRGRFIDIDCHPRIRKDLGNPSVPLWITEGVKKADSAISQGLCCIALTGVWNFRGTNPQGGRTELAAWDKIAISGRTIYIAYDSDAWEKDSILLAMIRLGGLLARRGANVRWIRIPTPDGRKVGLDDFFVGGGTVQQLMAVATPEPPGSLGIEDALKCELSELGNAERMVLEVGADFRYVHKWRTWMHWNGRTWAREDGEATVFQATFDLIKRLQADAAEETNKAASEARAKWVQSCHKEITLRKTVELFRHQPGIPASDEEWDRDPWLFNAANGTLDLRTGDLHPFERDDMITNCANVAYDPNAICPTWEKFLTEILPGDDARLNYLWKAIGYTLTGSVAEQVFFFLQGEGANGKSTLIDTLRYVLGPYARTVMPETFMEAKPGAIRGDLARLQGSRSVFATETQEGRRLDETLIKVVTGDAKVAARQLYTVETEFDPTFKVWMLGNHRPAISGTDHGIWRRVALIMFDVQIPPEQRDRNLPIKLMAEAPGILAWAVRGCQAYLEEGLKMPDSIVAAVESYHDESDQLGRFIFERTITASGDYVTVRNFYTAYKTWCEKIGEKPTSEKKMSQRMKSRGMGSVLDPSRGKVMVFAGLQLAEDSTHDHVYRGSID